VRGVQIVVSCRNDARIQLITHPIPNDTQHGANVRASLAIGVVEGIGDSEARILLVHDNASFRDLIRDVSVPATAHSVPSAPAFPPMDELARIAASHDLRPIGPPMSAEDGDSILAAAS
jgi:hypothetical protein